MTAETLLILSCGMQVLMLLALAVVAFLALRKKDSLPLELFKSELEKQQITFKTELDSVRRELEITRSEVGKNLENVTNQVGAFGEIQKGIGEVREAATRIGKLGENISELQDILKSPKLRGGFGEILLGNLLQQVLPEALYQIQYSFSDSTRADAVIFLGERILPIDSKFPLEKFQELLVEGQTAGKKAFATAVKKRIDETSKYIRPDEKTYDFAMMYIPAENVYYSIISDKDIFEHALNCRVIPVSPNSFYAYLQVVAFGLRDLQIEQNARLILERLTTLSKDYEGVTSAYETLGTHLNNAKNKYDEAQKKSERFGDKLGAASKELSLDPVKMPELPE